MRRLTFLSTVWLAAALTLAQAQKGGEVPKPPGDVNGDGVLDLKDLPAFVTAWMKARAGQAVPEADIDGDGHVDWEDARALVEMAVTSPTGATLVLSPAAFTGPGTLTITLTDPDMRALSQLPVLVRSGHGDPDGEVVYLARQGDRGQFVGHVGLARIFSETRYLPPEDGDGKVGVYAEGGIGQDEVTVAYYDVRRPGGSSTQAEIEASATYEEPPSTVTGVVRDDEGNPVAGAAVRLVGNGIDRVTASRSQEGFVGHFSFYDVPSGTYTVVVRREGYARQTYSVTVP